MIGSFSWAPFLSNASWSANKSPKFLQPNSSIISRRSKKLFGPCNISSTRAVYSLWSVEPAGVKKGNT